MDARQLARLNIAVLAAAGLAVVYSVLASPFGSIALASWSSAPFAVFVPLLAVSSTAIQHKCNLAALVVFSFIAMALVGSAVQPTDPFSGVVVWVVPAALFVAATLACGVAALVGRILVRKVHGAQLSAQADSRGRGES